MDTPQRWQLASTVTAVAGLGIGALLLGRPNTAEIATIDLDTVIAVESRQDAPIEEPARLPEVVEPRVLVEVRSEPADPGSADRGSADAASPRSVSTPEPPASSASPASVDSPAAPATPDSPDSPDSPGSPDSAASPGSVDSPDSIDSD